METREGTRRIPGDKDGEKTRGKGSERKVKRKDWGGKRRKKTEGQKGGRAEGQKETEKKKTGRKGKSD